MMETRRRRRPTFPAPCPTCEGFWARRWTYEVKVFDVQSPSALFERGGPLEGFDRASIKPADITSDRARRLR
jgi:hypothetical protein